MPSDVSSRVLLHTVGQSEQVGYLGSALQGTCAVTEEGDGSRDLAGDDRMKIFVHCCSFGIHGLHTRSMPGAGLRSGHRGGQGTYRHVHR